MAGEGKQSADGFYEVKTIQETDMDSSWRNKDASMVVSDGAAAAQARDLAEDDKLRETYRKIAAIMEEDESPVNRGRQAQAPTGRVRRKMPQMTMEDLGGGPSTPSHHMTMDDLAEGLSAEDMEQLGLGIVEGVNQAATRAFQDGYTGQGDELSLMAESNAAHPYNTSEDWKTEKAMARLKGGKQVPVWLVVNEASGMKIEKPFRIQPPAEKIAVILNMTGNANDPRIQQIQEDYDKHVRLTKIARQAGRALNEGREVNQQKYRRLLAELEGVNARLGI